MSSALKNNDYNQLFKNRIDLKEAEKTLNLPNSLQNVFSTVG